MKIGIFANMAKAAASSTLAEIGNAAKKHQVELVTCSRETARQISGVKAKVVAHGLFGKSVDALLSLGGDGTVLQAIRALGGADVPILGINLGNLGFLTSVPDDQAVAALSALVAKNYTIARYPLLEAHLTHGRQRRFLARALNDVVMGWGTSPRATMIEVEVDHQPVASFVCDGLIVATPVGSTGHALSAGGPILHRETSALVIEPICPHTLSNRPVVLPSDRLITLRIGDTRKPLLVSVDGQDHGWIAPGDTLEIQQSAASAHFAQLPGTSWFNLLTQKLHWRGSSADPK